MIQRDDLPETPDWQPVSRNDPTACANCGDGQRFCSLNVEWHRQTCCERCDHGGLREVLVWQGDDG